MEPEDIEEESLLSFIGRVESRPSLCGLNNILFDSGPRVKEVIEITGGLGFGKTQILYDLMTTCILPVEHKGQVVGGLGSGVVLVSFNQQFDIQKIVQLMEVRLKSRLEHQLEQVKEVVESSLKRLAVVRVHSEEDRLLAFLAVKNHVCSNSEVSLVVMDSICDHYWTLVGDEGPNKMDSYVEEILNSLNQMLSAFKITLIYTRPSYFFSKGVLPSDLSTDCNLRNINTRIKLKQHFSEDNLVRIAEVHSGASVRIVFYEITEKGIQWTK